MTIESEARVESSGASSSSFVFVRPPALLRVDQPQLNVERLLPRCFALPLTASPLPPSSPPWGLAELASVGAPGDGLSPSPGWVVRTGRRCPAAPLIAPSLFPHCDCVLVQQTDAFLNSSERRSVEGDANAIAVRVEGRKEERRQGGVDGGGSGADGQDYRAPSNIEEVDTSI